MTDRLAYIQSVVKEHTGQQLHNTSRPHTFAIVEGPSFGSPGRQADLAMARAAGLLALNYWGLQIKIVAPKSIRKSVFGSGLVRAEDVWREVAPDAASAIACAIAAGKMTT